MVLIWKKMAIFDLFLTFFKSPGKKTQKFLQHISHLQKYTYFAHPIDFFVLPICKNYEFIMYGFSMVRLLVLILICAIFEQSNK